MDYKIDLLNYLFEAGEYFIILDKINDMKKIYRITDQQMEKIIEIQQTAQFKINGI